MYETNIHLSVGLANLSQIIPFADQIISLLPPLWEQAGDEYLMKQSILAILSALVTSMKDASRKYHPLILPLIQSSVEPESETRTYLLEDAVDLWHAILIQTPEPTQEILNLARYLIPMFDTATDTLRKALDITESYFLLAPHAILQACTGFVSVFANLLGGQLKREANGVITYLVEILVRAADSLGGSVAVEALTKNLIDTQLLSKLLTGLKVAYDAHQTTGPNRVYSDVDGIVETDYLSVLARIAFASPSTFIAAIDGASPRNESLEDTMRWLFTEWFSHSENVGTADKKKLMCLALTSFLKLGTEMWSMGYLQDMMTMWTDVITECVDYPEEGGEGKDTLIYWDMESLKGGGIEAPEDIRRRNVSGLLEPDRNNVLVKSDSFFFRSLLPIPYTVSISKTSFASTCNKLSTNAGARKPFSKSSWSMLMRMSSRLLGISASCRERHYKPPIISRYLNWYSW